MAGSINVYNPDTGKISMQPGGGSGGGGGGGAGGAMAAVGAVAGAVGSIYSGFQQSRSLKASAKAKELEAEQVRQQGIWTQIQGNEQRRRAMATQRAIFGAAGVTLDGAPGHLMRRSNQAAVLDRMMAARNFRNEVSALHADARQMRKAASAAKRSGIIGAFSSF